MQDEISYEQEREIDGNADIYQDEDLDIAEDDEPTDQEAQYSWTDVKKITSKMVTESQSDLQEKQPMNIQQDDYHSDVDQPEENSKDLSVKDHPIEKSLQNNNDDEYSEVEELSQGNINELSQELVDQIQQDKSNQNIENRDGQDIYDEQSEKISVIKNEDESIIKDVSQDSMVLSPSVQNPTILQSPPNLDSSNEEVHDDYIYDDDAESEDPKTPILNRKANDKKESQFQEVQGEAIAVADQESSSQSVAQELDLNAQLSDQSIHKQEEDKVFHGESFHKQDQNEEINQLEEESLVTIAQNLSKDINNEKEEDEEEEYSEVKDEPSQTNQKPHNLIKQESLNESLNESYNESFKDSQQHSFIDKKPTQKESIKQESEDEYSEVQNEESQINDQSKEELVNQSIAKVNSLNKSDHYSEDEIYNDEEESVKEKSIHHSQEVTQKSESIANEPVEIVSPQIMRKETEKTSNYSNSYEKESSVKSKEDLVAEKQQVTFQKSDSEKYTDVEDEPIEEKKINVAENKQQQQEVYSDNESQKYSSDGYERENEMIMVNSTDQNVNPFQQSVSHDSFQSENDIPKGTGISNESPIKMIQQVQQSSFQIHQMQKDRKSSSMESTERLNILHEEDEDKESENEPIFINEKPGNVRVPQAPISRESFQQQLLNTCAFRKDSSIATESLQSVKEESPGAIYRKKGGMHDIMKAHGVDMRIYGSQRISNGFKSHKPLYLNKKAVQSASNLHCDKGESLDTKKLYDQNKNKPQLQIKKQQFFVRSYSKSRQRLSNLISESRTFTHRGSDNINPKEDIQSAFLSPMSSSTGFFSSRNKVPNVYSTRVKPRKPIDAYSESKSSRLQTASTTQRPRLGLQTKDTLSEIRQFSKIERTSPERQLQLNSQNFGAPVSQRKDKEINLNGISNQGMVQLSKIAQLYSKPEVSLNSLSQTRKFKKIGHNVRPSSMATGRRQNQGNSHSKSREREQIPVDPFATPLEQYFSKIQQATSPLPIQSSPKLNSEVKVQSEDSKSKNFIWKVHYLNQVMKQELQYNYDAFREMKKLSDERQDIQMITPIQQIAQPPYLKRLHEQETAQLFDQYEQEMDVKVINDQGEYQVPQNLIKQSLAKRKSNIATAAGIRELY